MAKNPGAKDSKGRYIDPAAAIKAGLMTKKSGEIITPGKIAAKVAGKVADKAAAKSLAKAKANASKIIGKDISKPGSIEKIVEGMTQAEKRALAAKLKETNVKGKKDLYKKPTQASPTKYKIRSKSTGKLSTFDPNK